jgi:hypothetical protein
LNNFLTYLGIATHGIIKKTDKVPRVEIEKARTIMKLYFEQKLKNEKQGKLK